MKISEPDKFLIKRLIDVRNKGYYANGKECTDLYNKIFDAHLAPTSCGSCIRTRINLLEKELRRQEAEEAKELEAKALEEAQVAENKDEKENRKEEQNGKVRERVQRTKRSSKKAVD